MTARASFTARRAAPYLVAFSVASALVAALYTHQSQAEAPVVVEAAVPVSVSRIMPNRVKLWVEFSGRLESVERVEPWPRVAGTIQGLHFQEGALVTRGDQLITIDPALYAAQAEAVVEAALCATPGYLVAREPIKTPQDLSRQECLGYLHPELSKRWTLFGPEGTVTVPVSGRLMVDSGEALMAAARTPRIDLADAHPVLFRIDA